MRRMPTIATTRTIDRIRITRNTTRPTLVLITTPFD